MGQSLHAFRVKQVRSKLSAAMPFALHVLPSNQRPSAVLHQKNLVGVGEDSMAPAAIVPSVDIVIGARVVVKGCLARRVPAQHPQDRGLSESVDVERAGSPYMKQHAMLHKGAVRALPDCTKQTLAMMLASCLVPSMLCQSRELCRQTIVFAATEHTRSRRLKRVTVAAVRQV